MNGKSSGVTNMVIGVANVVIGRTNVVLGKLTRMTNTTNELIGSRKMHSTLDVEETWRTWMVAGRPSRLS
eukprot:1445507-Alexandrium_andersonii.AAC.1